ncbi:unnamed protein product [Periconia digitata]|uniref:Uncharacterized protein n=1 Tax=Periconia digitata TaxID=1303443 RepID=A0A9W4UFU4_9PLEO|nr:unnamed protein product [Periconia digitata]
MVYTLVYLISPLPLFFRSYCVHMHAGTYGNWALRMDFVESEKMQTRVSLSNIIILSSCTCACMYIW